MHDDDLLVGPFYQVKLDRGGSIAITVVAKIIKINDFWSVTAYKIKIINPLTGAIYELENCHSCDFIRLIPIEEVLEIVRSLKQKLDDFVK